MNDLERRVGTHLYGRRRYEVMVAWETIDLVDQPHFIRDFAEIWRAADKVVYSRSLENVASARTRIERHFEPEAVRQLKAGAERDLTIGGAELAAQAITSRLIDELHLFLAPVVVGRRHARAPGRRARAPRPAGRAALRQRHGLPSLLHEAVTADEYARWVRWTPKPAELRRPLESYFICGTPVAGRPHEWFWRDTRTSLKRAWGVDDADEYLELG